MKIETLETLGYAVIIIVITFILAYFVGQFLRRLIKKSQKKMDFDPTNYNFIRHITVAAIYIIGGALAISAVPQLSKITTSLLAGAGIAAVAIGFASQQALSNVVSGFFIIIFKPFRIRDRIMIRDRTLSGVIEDITLRHVVIRDFENRRIIVPNSIISDEVIVNSDFADEKICKFIEVGISYESNISKAKEIIVEEIKKHPLFMDNRTPEDIESGKPEVMVRVLGFGESSVNLRGWAWASDQADAFVLGCDVYESLKMRFDEANIEIPYPHRTLTYKNGKE